MLIGLLIPAVQSARESARLNECCNNLRQIGAATILFHDARQAFPPARLRARSFDDPSDNCESTQPSWYARILPFLEESAAGELWDPYDAYENHSPEVRDFAPAVFSCPTRRGGGESVVNGGTVEVQGQYACGCYYEEIVQLTGGAAGDYAGNHGDFTGGASGDETDYWRGGNGTGIIVSSRPRCQEGKVMRSRA